MERGITQKEVFAIISELAFNWESVNFERYLKWLAYFIGFVTCEGWFLQAIFITNALHSNILSKDKHRTKSVP
jgi:hypothetical protein